MTTSPKQSESRLQRQLGNNGKASVRRGKSGDVIYTIGCTEDGCIHSSYRTGKENNYTAAIARHTEHLRWHARNRETMPVSGHKTAPRGERIASTGPDHLEGVA